MHNFADFDRVQLMALAGPPAGGYLSGYYYQATPGPGLSTSQSANGVLRVGKVRIAQRVTLTRLGAEVTAIGDAGSTFRMAVLADSTATPNYPGALLLDAGASGSASTVLNNGLIAGDNASVQEVTVLLVLDPGVYWFGGTTQGVVTTAPTYRTVSSPLVNSDPMPIGTTAPTGTQSPTFGYTYSGVTGAVPAAFTTTKSLSSVLPRIFFKAG